MGKPSNYIRWHEEAMTANDSSKAMEVMKLEAASRGCLGLKVGLRLVSGSGKLHGAVALRVFWALQVWRLQERVKVSISQEL
jgi:hypothetical protein